MLSAYLPDDLMVDILTRLPLSSLLRFKTVCKSWYALVATNSKFLIAHLHHSQVNCKDYIFLFKHLYTPKHNSSEKLCIFSLLYCFSETGSTKHVELDHLPFLKHMKLKYIDIVSQCNGLVCLSYWDDPPQLYLWNPSISSDFNLKALPSTPMPPTPGGFTFWDPWTIGFGVDRQTNEYKVVRIWSFYEWYGGPLRANKVEEFKVGNESWREIDASPLSTIKSRLVGPLYAKGRCYWEIMFSCPQKLVSFDFLDEVFKVIVLPEARIVGTCSQRWGDIVVMNDSIALISSPLDMNDKCFEVWLMNEEPKGSWQMSWNKIMTVEMPHSNLCPLMVFANGEVVLQDSDLKLHLYNSLTGVIKNLNVEFEGSDKLVVCGESLVSFKEGVVL